MKPEFYIEDYIDTKRTVYTMHCQTYEEAKVFTTYLHSLGRKWRTGRSYLKIHNYYAESYGYGKETCYFFNKGTVGSRAHIRFLGDNCKVVVLSFSDFNWDSYNANKSMEIILTDNDNKNFVDFMSPYLEVKNEI